MTLLPCLLIARAWTLAKSTSQEKFAKALLSNYLCLKLETAAKSAGRRQIIKEIPYCVSAKGAYRMIIIAISTCTCRDVHFLRDDDRDAMTYKDICV